MKHDVYVCTLCSEKNSHFCFLAQLLEKVTNLNVTVYKNQRRNLVRINVEWKDQLDLGGNTDITVTSML